MIEPSILRQCTAAHGRLAHLLLQQRVKTVYNIKSGSASEPIVFEGLWPLKNLYTSFDILDHEARSVYPSVVEPIKKFQTFAHIVRSSARTL